MKWRLLTLAVFIGFAAVVPANASIVGTPIGDPDFPSWQPNSTNELNFMSLVPGREVQVAPFVVLEDVGPSSITLKFVNGSVAGAFFEYRIDGLATGTNTHPIVVGDTIHQGYWRPTGSPDFLGIFNDVLTVDVRLALGGERDWDFNWTRFEAGAAPIPEPTSLAIWSVIALGGLGLAYRRRKRTV